MKDKPARSKASGEGAAVGDITVFSITRESACAECKAELKKEAYCGSKVSERSVSHNADLDHLWFLPRGDVALTRRASKYSTLRAVVVRFSRALKRYERQGILIEEAALARAEQECLADADARERARERTAERRERHDEHYIREFADRLGDMFPGCPLSDRQAIADHACQKYSGRVGRSAAAQDFDPKAIELAVRAHVRHVHTPYDRLLAGNTGREEARAAVRDDVEEVMQRWRVP